MAEIHGLDIVRDGLVLHLDAANPQSFDGNSTTWRDLSGNGNNASFNSIPNYLNDNKGNLIYDVKTKSSILDSNSIDILGTSNLTVSYVLFNTEYYLLQHYILNLSKFLFISFSN